MAELDYTLVGLFISTWVGMATLYYKIAKVESKTDAISSHITTSMKFKGNSNGSRNKKL